MPVDVSTVPEFEAYASTRPGTTLDSFLGWWKDAGVPQGTDPRTLPDDYQLLQALASRGDADAQNILASSGLGPPATFTTAQGFFESLVASFGGGGTPSMGTADPVTAPTTALPPADAGAFDVAAWIRSFPSYDAYLRQDYLSGGRDPDAYDAKAYEASRPDLAANWARAFGNSAPPSTAPTSPLSTLANLVNTSAGGGKPAPGEGAVTIAPVNAPVTSAVYNVNANPAATIVPVLQQQSGFFANVLSGFTDLVAKVTDVARTAPNPNNSAVTAAGNFQRPQAFMQPIAALSQPRSPSNTVATVSGIPGQTSTVVSSNENSRLLLILGVVGLAAALFLFFRRR